MNSKKLLQKDPEKISESLPSFWFWKWATAGSTAILQLHAYKSINGFQVDNYMTESCLFRAFSSLQVPLGRDKVDVLTKVDCGMSLSVKLTAKVKIGRNPKGKYIVSQPSIFTIEIQSPKRKRNCLEAFGVLGSLNFLYFKKIKLPKPSQKKQTILSPMIMEVEDGRVWKVRVTTMGRTHFSLPWLWEEGKLL